MIDRRTLLKYGALAPLAGFVPLGGRIANAATAALPMAYRAPAAGLPERPVLNGSGGPGRT